MHFYVDTYESAFIYFPMSTSLDSGKGTHRNRHNVSMRPVSVNSLKGSTSFQLPYYFFLK